MEPMEHEPGQPEPEIPRQAPPPALVASPAPPAESTPAGELLALPAEGVVAAAVAELLPSVIGGAAALAPDRHPALVYLRRLASLEGQRVQRHVLDVIAHMLTNGACDIESLPWHQVRYQHTAAIRAVLAQRFAIATANRALSALRGVLKEAWRLGYMNADEYRRAVDVESVSGITLPPGRALAEGELRAVFAACAADDRPQGVRDAALFAVLFGAGLRRSEAVGLDLGDFNTSDGTITVRRGKGRKDRMVPLPGGAQAYVRDWILMRGHEEGAMLCPITKGGTIRIRRITAQAVLERCEKRALEAGVPTFSPHDERRTFISRLLESGADLATVQRLAGHAKSDTTVAYDRRGDAAKRQAVDRMPFPYIGRAQGRLFERPDEERLSDGGPMGRSVGCGWTTARASTASARTTRGGRSSRRSSTPAPTWSSSSASPGTRTSRRPPATTAAARG